MKRFFLFLLLIVSVSALMPCHAEGAPAVSDDVKIDLDLSGMSGTIVYSQIYNIMYEPDKYIGKTIRLNGYYDAYEDSETGNVYFACIVPDAAACCAQGIEFVREDEALYPEDYPEPGTDILVTGRLEPYTENGFDYLHLVDAVLVWDSERD